MAVTDKQYKTAYVIFVGLFAVNLAITAYNFYEERKVRRAYKDYLSKISS